MAAPNTKRFTISLHYRAKFPSQAAYWLLYFDKEEISQAP